MNKQFDCNISEISKKTNISRQYISKILRNKIKNPGIKTLKIIADAIGCNLEELGY